MAKSTRLVHWQRSGGLIFTSEAVQAIAGAAQFQFRQTAVSIGQNRYFVPLSSDVIDGLRRAKLDGETPSETAIRLLGSRKGLN